MLNIKGRTSQIDNLLVTRYGIFVVEAKNYSGVVKGYERADTWVQSYPKSKNKYPPREFYNPILQNEKHIRALKSLLMRSYPKLQYYNIVAFSDDCKIPNIPGVTSFSKLTSTINNFMPGSPVLSEKDVSDIKSLIQSNNITSKKARAEHINYARESAVKAKEEQLQELRRRRAEANKSAALKIQELYDQGRKGLVDESKPSLDSVMKNCESISKAVENKPSVIKEKENVL